MRLLIVTQAVDKDDPVLGFFLEWIRQLAERCEFVHVICLKEGLHSLPSNVRVHSLGKESGASRFKYLARFFHYIYHLRHEYDSVFVHMNPEYVVLGGLFWRQWRKKIVLWFIHRRISLYLRIAYIFVHAICTASHRSINIQGKKIKAVGHGVDTARYSGHERTKNTRSILFLGRLDPIKRVDVFVDALLELHLRGVSFTADIYGSPSPGYTKDSEKIKENAASLIEANLLTMHESIPHEETPPVYASHAIFVNLTPPGSFDKTILEACASGAVVIAANGALRGVLPETLQTDGTKEHTVSALEAALSLSDEERRDLGERNRKYVEDKHALPQLIEKLVQALK